MAKVTEGKHLPLKKKVKEAVLVPMTKLAWKKIKSGIDEQKPYSKEIDSLVIISPHAADPMASKGDEAMLVGVVKKLKALNPKLEITVAVAEEYKNDKISPLGVKIKPFWSYPFDLKSVFKECLKYDACFCIGADVMDGHYTSIKSLRTWMLADLIARTGRPTTIGGFSWNQSPTKPVVDFVKDSLTPKLNVFLRDDVSHSRFVSISNHPAKVVADNAFLLQPSAEKGIEEVLNWVTKQRNDGRDIVAFNVHPMLVPDRNPQAISELVNACVNSAKKLIEDQGASILLIPHDYRDGVGDLEMLAQVEAGISNKEYVFNFTDMASAAQLKELAKSVDLVITARMHLSIGALGTGTPILCITYQGKFQGLMNHFSLSHDVLITPDEARDVAKFEEFCLAGFAQKAELRAQVEKELPTVKEKSLLNLRAMLPAVDM
ncbi:polysaccharide pyruvyl transferase family protein [Corallincola platygyrae]|uniref:Polysaccharide pyruvyl transferase family protein n=1 Tax=Corallincola platygyrae TaxID=1193278 RepID=A0ABW4XL62_9GAMM